MKQYYVTLKHLFDFALEVWFSIDKILSTMYFYNLNGLFGFILPYTQTSLCQLWVSLRK